MSKPTKKSNLEVSPLTRDHLIEWYEEQGQAPTVKGIAVHLDGELVAIGGLRHLSGRWFAFVDLKPEIRPHKTFIHRQATKYLKEQKSRHRRLFALREDSEPTSGRWLSVLGFKEVTEDIWQWHH